jgi:FlaA1/EpsC-like NDP-sugar epimerase
VKSTSIYRNFLLILAADAVLLAAAWYSSYLLRFNLEIPAEFIGSLWRMLPLVLGVKLVTFYFFDLYRGMWRYTGLVDLLNVIKAGAVSSLVVTALVLFTHGFAGLSRSVFIIDGLLTVVLVAGLRTGIRLYFWLGAGDETARSGVVHLFRLRRLDGKRAKRLLLIGAGDCGEMMYREIQENAQLRYQVVGFIDDDPTKVGKSIHGVPVLGTTGQLKDIAARMKADEVLIAVPSATSRQMRAIVEHCKESAIPFKTVPGLGEIVNGRVTVSAIREVDYHDLLGREPVHLEEGRIGAYLKDARVLVTGAGGSIGSELCRQICRFLPAALALYERAETPLYEMELELKGRYPGIEIVPMLADIRDGWQLERALSAFRPQVVFHAAAYKHVPMLELQPWKAVRNNISGTSNVIEVSKRLAVERFVFVSTDKAVRPTNVLGASKRVAEMLVQSQNGCDPSATRFMIVRFGNVLGSVGSVVPLFKKQIAQGGPVTVTHPQATRYFMTIPEACQLILQAGSMGEGGEIFILKMGTPIKIDDLARDLIRLSGFEPEVDIPIRYIGLRPGEKLCEELITEGEGIVPTSHDNILVLRGKECNLEVLNDRIDELVRLADRQDPDGIRATLREVVGGSIDLARKAKKG